MNGFKVRVENGRLVGPAPAALPEGEELELCLLDEGDDLTPEQLIELNRALEAGWESLRAGRFRPAEDLIRDLRRRR